MPKKASSKVIESNRKKFALVNSMTSEDISVDALQVAAAYQRGLKTSSSNHIAKHFAPEAFGTLTVGRRKNGSMWVVDGQTRQYAAVLLGMETVPCRVFKSRGSRHEATVFRQVNSQRGISKPDQFRALLTEKEPQSLEIESIVKAVGFKIAFSKSNRWDQINCITTLQKLFNWGVLGSTLRTVKDSWEEHEENRSTGTTILEGIGRFIVKYGDTVDQDHLVKRLSETSVAFIFSQCETICLQGGSRAKAVVPVLVSIYNKNKRKNKIGDELNA